MKLVVLFAFCLVPASLGFSWPDNVTQHSGYINVNQTHGGEMFYWMFESRQSPAKDPLILWLTGGPGCASDLALLAENGPFLMNETSKELYYNDYGWNSFANLLYVDQPVGTGFSYVADPEKHVFNENEVAQDLLTFMTKFYTLYPQYSNVDLYIIGESYAGHYVPATAALIMKSDSLAARNLKGIGIGDGWVDPLHQYHSYGDFAYAQGLINEAEYAAANASFDVCKGLILTKLWPVALEECQTVLEGVIAAAELKLKRSINLYDVRKPCSDPPLCYNFDAVTEFLNRKDVQEALGVSRAWESCSQLVHLFMLGDWISAFDDDVAALLNAGLRVVVYSGKYDLVCNYFGGKDWVSNMKWRGQENFSKAPVMKWTVDGAEAGQAQSADGLTFLAVDNAGHLVPMDQGKNALDMVHRLLNNLPFN
ncbi:uncharacterized protein [Oscarella lobularis]|uniref:uncharacterized protein n=1 Tax=Oscarella lobularis TaxID=121494 RepID=UPI0033133AC9